MAENALEKFEEMKQKVLENQVPLTAKMEELMTELEALVTNPVIEAAFNEAQAHVAPYNLSGLPNPWRYFSINQFVQYFRFWFTYLPGPVGGLGYIVPFTWFYLENQSAYYFLNELKTSSNGATTFSREIFNWTVKFIMERGNFMDSTASAGKIKQWTDDPNTKINEFVTPKGGFKTFNDFFTRELDPDVNARPINEPDDDSIVTATADTILNFILSDLTMKTTMDVKGRQLNVKQLLHYSSYAKEFEGGTAISCVLMPGVYHHYHSPVSGKIVEGVDVPGVYNGIVDGEHWFNDVFNIGESTTDFSIFEDFHRAYFIIKTESHGYVAVIPVGLNTISRITPSVVHKRSVMVPRGGKPVKIKKGQPLGGFAYGGSLNILLFQKGSFSSINVLMGQRIGVLAPPSTD